MWSVTKLLLVETHCFLEVVVMRGVSCDVKELMFEPGLDGLSITASFD